MAMTREQYIAQFYESTDRDFTGVDLSGVDLSDCRWNYADFTGADLTDTDLTNAGGPGANFNGADLSASVAPRANFTRADLRDAELTLGDVTDWRDACLVCADLRGTDFTGVLLSGADLSGALRLTTDDALTGWDQVSDWDTVRARDIAYNKAQAGYTEGDLIARQWTKLPMEPPFAIAAGSGFISTIVRYLARVN